LNAVGGGRAELNVAAAGERELRTLSFSEAVIKFSINTVLERLLAG
jgi:hypothetical protein